MWPDTGLSRTETEIQGPARTDRQYRGRPKHSGYVAWMIYGKLSEEEEENGLTETGHWGRLITRWWEANKASWAEQSGVRRSYKQKTEKNIRWWQTERLALVSLAALDVVAIPLYHADKHPQIPPSLT